MESEALRHKQQVELSYLANDTSESNNIADNHPALVSKAKKFSIQPELTQSIFPLEA